MTLLAIAVLALIGATIAAIRRPSSRYAPVIHPTAGPELRRAIVGAQRRALAASIIAAVVLIGAIYAAISRPYWLGLPAAVAPALAGVAGILLYAISPAPSAGARGQHQLPAQVWRAGRFAPRDVVTLLAVGAGQTVLLVVTGLTSSTDEMGLYRNISFSSQAGSTAGPYPGWYYAVPLLVATFLLVAVTLLALHRIANAPSSAGGNLVRADPYLRVVSSKIVAKIALCALFLQIAGVTQVAASTISSALARTSKPWYAFAALLMLLAAAALVAAVRLGAQALLRAVSLPKAIWREDTSESSPAAVV